MSFGTTIVLVEIVETTKQLTNTGTPSPYTTTTRIPAQLIHILSAMQNFMLVFWELMPMENTCKVQVNHFSNKRNENVKIQGVLHI